MNASAYGESNRNAAPPGFILERKCLVLDFRKRKSPRFSSEAFAFSLHIFGGLNASAYGESNRNAAPPGFILERKCLVLDFRKRKSPRFSSEAFAFSLHIFGGMNVSAYGESNRNAAPPGFILERKCVVLDFRKRKSPRFSSEAFAFSLHIFGGLNASAYGESNRNAAPPGFILERNCLVLDFRKRKSPRFSSEAFAFSLHIFGGLNASAFGESNRNAAPPGFIGSTQKVGGGITHIFFVI
ncbi:MAG: hypothetical protein IPQ23_16950 [Cytophagaceae bacterium]|nr:hypothetical protein [Cytophagaceae bacterium]